MAVSQDPGALPPQEDAGRRQRFCDPRTNAHPPASSPPPSPPGRRAGKDTCQQLCGWETSALGPGVWADRGAPGPPASQGRGSGKQQGVGLLRGRCERPCTPPPSRDPAPACACAGEAGRGQSDRAGGRSPCDSHSDLLYLGFPWAHRVPCRLETSVGAQGSPCPSGARSLWVSSVTSVSWSGDKAHAAHPRV